LGLSTKISQFQQSKSYLLYALDYRLSIRTSVWNVKPHLKVKFCTILFVVVGKKWCGKWCLNVVIFIFWQSSSSRLFPAWFLCCAGGCETIRCGRRYAFLLAQIKVSRCRTGQTFFYKNLYLVIINVLNYLFGIWSKHLKNALKYLKKS